MAETLRIPLRIVFYKENDRYFARCLEFDLIGDGENRDEALDALTNAIGIQIECSLEHGNPRNLFTPADGKYFQMYAAGRDVGTGAMSIHISPHISSNVVIEGPEYREYEHQYNDDLALA